MRVTIKDIAVRSNLSHTTVSRVLNRRGDAFISEETRQRIFALAREMGYQPNTIARALATGRSNTIALSLGAVVHPLAALVIQNLMQEVETQNYEIIISKVATANDDNDAPLTQWPVDGFLFFNTPPPASAIEGVANPKAIVAMGTGCVEIIDHVEVDLHHGFVQAMKHLIEGGSKRIAHMTMESLAKDGDPRTDAYRSEMRAAGLKEELIFQPELYLPASQSADAHAAVARHVKEYGYPDAIICRNDHMALGAYRALRDHGCRIPEDVALVGCDGIAEAKYLDAPLTTIEQPITEMCEIGWQFLKNRLDDPSLPIQSALLQSKLVIRKSSQR
jgi:LacI family transcriptional regulator